MPSIQAFHKMKPKKQKSARAKSVVDKQAAIVKTKEKRRPGRDQDTKIQPEEIVMSSQGHSAKKKNHEEPEKNTSVYWETHEPAPEAVHKTAQETAQETIPEVKVEKVEITFPGSERFYGPNCQGHLRWLSKWPRIGSMMEPLRVCH